MQRLAKQNYEEVMTLTEKNAKQNHEAVMTLADQNNDKITATLHATLSTMRQENHARFARADRNIDENANALEAMQTWIDARIGSLEHSKNSTSSGCRKGNEQNSVPAVATGSPNRPQKKK